MSEQTSVNTPQQETSKDDLFSEIYDLEPYERTLKNARIWLYVIAALQFIMGIVEYNQSDDATVGWIAF
ncbi:MAG: hypothetical protein ACXWV0_06710, partial [Flavisolibacter sp.]